MAQNPEKFPQEDREFVEALNKAVSEQPGIVQAQIDRKKNTVKFDYDPEKISQSDIYRLAQKLGPAVQRLLSKSTFRLQGRASEASALVLENKLQKQKGIKRATASFIGGVMSVTYNEEIVSPSQIMEKVRALGAHIKPIAQALTEEEEERKHPPEGWKNKILYWLRPDRLEIIFTHICFFSMSLGAILHHFPVWNKSLYVLAYITGGWFGVQAGWKSLRQLTVDVDLLMILAALGAAYVNAPFEGAMLLFLFSLSNVLQTFAIGRTRKAIKSLAKMRPQKAIVARGDFTTMVAIENVQLDERILIRPGDRIPLDGQVVAGESSVDQSSVTGESMPVNKEPGDIVFAGTINQFGSLTVAVTKLAKDSTISKLITMVEEAQSEKAKTQRFLDKAEQAYSIAVIGLTIALMFILPLFHETFDSAIYTAITVMVVASPCALIIGVPASILSAIGNGALQGILFKGGAYLEKMATVKVVAFDKTGTLTEGKPCMTEIFPLRTNENRLSKEDLLLLAASVEAKSEHPLAQAVVKYALEKGIKLEEEESFQSFRGRGAAGIVKGRKIFVGSPKWFEELAALDKKTKTKIYELEELGKTTILVGAEKENRKEMIGIIALEDKIRPDAPRVVQELRKIGVNKILMLTGDSKRVARAVAKEINVDDFYAELLPEDKVRLLKTLSQGFPVAMVGDGANDAPALAAATVGMAMGAAGSDVALESADVVLMSNDLEKIPYALKLSLRARQVMIQNLAFAGMVVLLMISLTLALPFFGKYIPLPIGVLAHEGGTVLVCLNGLRLLAFNFRPCSH